VHVHAGAVVAVVGLGHEGGRLAVAVATFQITYFMQLRPVGALDQGAELGADFVLAGAGHFVVEHFDRDAQDSSISAISARMSCVLSTGGTGK
jgi:D-arabinose 1-dehydrogenase-like Zn-dependent alcohol dehydrogenase